MSIIFFSFLLILGFLQSFLLDEDFLQLILQVPDRLQECVQVQDFFASLDNNPGSESFGSVTSVTGVGEFLNHGRNEFYAQVSNLNHRGKWTSNNQLSKWSWGIDAQNEAIEDQLFLLQVN